MGRSTIFSEGTIDDDFATQNGINKVILALEAHAGVSFLVWVD